jgi:hypothetical protein
VAILSSLAPVRAKVSSVRVEMWDTATGKPIACSTDVGDPIDVAAPEINIKGYFAGSGTVRTKAAVRRIDSANLWYQNTKLQQLSSAEELLVDIDQTTTFNPGQVLAITVQEVLGPSVTCYVRMTQYMHPLDANDVDEGKGEEYVTSMRIKVFNYSAGRNSPDLCGTNSGASRVGFMAFMTTSMAGVLVDTKILYDAGHSDHAAEHGHWLQRAYDVRGKTTEAKVIDGVQSITHRGPAEFHFASLDETTKAECFINFIEKS